MNSYEIKIQPDDLLTIVVSSDNSPESVIPFNPNIAFNPPSPLTFNPVTGTQQKTPPYLVDADGYIDFPVLGKLKVGGLMRTEVLQLIKEKISEYVKKPFIYIHLANFKVILEGEVASGGVMTFDSERVTLIEAIAKAGGLTIYGKRNNILIIRENNGVKTHNRVDITKADFINSPFYYLAQNDVVYIEPNKNAINKAAIPQNLGFFITIASILIALIIKL